MEIVLLAGVGVNLAGLVLVGYGLRNNRATAGFHGEIKDALQRRWDALDEREAAVSARETRAGGLT